jgi:lysophospholipase L1-like esterase
MNPIVLMIMIVVTMIPSQERVKVINAGIGGNTSGDLLGRVHDDVVSQNADLVILMVGTNDMVNSRKMVSYDTFKNNLLDIVNILKDADINIVLLSPLPVDTVYLFQRHQRSSYTELPNNKLANIRDIARQISEDNDLYFVDIFEEFVKRGLPEHNTDAIIRNVNNCGVNDGVHPTEKGYELMAQLVYDYLIGKKLIKQGMKVICFGDSITKGVHVKGEGTARGHTYPARLGNLINSYFINNSRSYD